MSENIMTIDEAIRYLQPIADSASLTRYSEALITAISAMEELAFTRNFIHEHGLEFTLMNAWNSRKDHIADDGKKVCGKWQRVYEDSLGWVDRCSCCKSVANEIEECCPSCKAMMKMEVT